MTSLAWVSGPGYAHGARRHTRRAKEKTIKNLTRQGVGRLGNAATRIEAFMYSQGGPVVVRDADIDAWYTQQITERDPQKRAALLQKIQQKAYDEALFMPIWESAFLCASGHGWRCQGCIGTRSPTPRLTKMCNKIPRKAWFTPRQVCA